MHADELDASRDSAAGLNALRSMQPQLHAVPLPSRTSGETQAPQQAPLLPARVTRSQAGLGQPRAAQATQELWGELLATPSKHGPLLPPAEHENAARDSLPRHFDKLPGYLKASARERGRNDSFQSGGLTATEILERVEANAGSEQGRLPVLRRSHPARDATRKDDFLRRGSGAVRTSVDSQLGLLASAVLK